MISIGLLGVNKLHFLFLVEFYCLRSDQELKSLVEVRDKFCCQKVG